MTGLSEALAALDAGRAIVMPTDTVYGIGARPDLEAAVASIFAIKERPEDRALPVLAAGIEALAGVAAFDEAALRLAELFWPGPLTIVLPRAEGFDHDLGGRDRATVAVRVPALDEARDLLRRSGPLAVTSANRSGEPPAATVEEARSALGDAVPVYLDAGRVGGAPSTVLVTAPEPRVLRRGALGFETLKKVLPDLVPEEGSG